MNSTHTLTRNGSDWELFQGAPYADRLMTTFVERKAVDALATASALIGGVGEWSQMTPSEYRRR